MTSVTLQAARMVESTWDMCIDDSLIIQIGYESHAGTELQNTEVYYRAKPPRDFPQ